MPRIYFPFYRLIGRRRFSPLLKSLTALRSPYTYVTRSSHFERIYMHRLRRIALISPGQRVVYRRYVCIRGSVPEYPRRTELGDARYRNAPTDLSSRTFMLSLCATAAECLFPPWRLYETRCIYSPVLQQRIKMSYAYHGDALMTLISIGDARV